MKPLFARFLLAVPLISTNLFAHEVPPTRVPVGPPAQPPVQFSPEDQSLPRAPLPSVRPQSAAKGGVQISLSYDGIDFLGSNCGCLPARYNAAVGGNFVVEAVNIWFRICDKNNGDGFARRGTQAFFGAPSSATPIWCTTNSQTAGT